jgi:hypothetical protein
MTQKRLHKLVRVSYVKASEYQHRGLMNLHAAIRLDRRMPAYRAEEVRTPDKRSPQGCSSRRCATPRRMSRPRCRHGKASYLLITSARSCSTRAR